MDWAWDVDWSFLCMPQLIPECYCRGTQDYQLWGIAPADDTQSKPRYFFFYCWPKPPAQFPIGDA